MDIRRIFKGLWFLIIFSVTEVTLASEVSGPVQSSGSSIPWWVWPLVLFIVTLTSG